METQIAVQNILGTFHPLIAYIVANASKAGSGFDHPLIRDTSILALARYMSISSIICEKYLPLLFTVLERDASEIVRTTIIIALGDLSFRFPNAVEPWTSRMYDRLCDNSVLVRYNTLMVNFICRYRLVLISR